MNSYELSRSWFDFCFENPEKIRPIHTAIYFFAIEHCNRLGWKDKFGFPSQMVMEAIGVKNWRTYSKALIEIVDFGFIDMIEISKNQYSSNIIAIVKNTKATTKATTKALDKALSKHSTKQSQSTVSINKQYNNITSNNITEIYPTFSDFWNLYDYKTGKQSAEKKWKKLKQSEKEAIIDYIPKYKLSTPDKQFRKHPTTFLNNKSWNDEININHETKQQNYSDIAQVIRSKYPNI